MDPSVYIPDTPQSAEYNGRLHNSHAAKRIAWFHVTFICTPTRLSLTHELSTEFLQLLLRLRLNVTRAT